MIVSQLRNPARAPIFHGGRGFPTGTGVAGPILTLTPTAPGVPPNRKRRRTASPAEPARPRLPARLLTATGPRCTSDVPGIYLAQTCAATSADQASAV